MLLRVGTLSQDIDALGVLNGPLFMMHRVATLSQAIGDHWQLYRFSTNHDLALWHWFYSATNVQTNDSWT